MTQVKTKYIIIPVSPPIQQNTLSPTSPTNLIQVPFKDFAQEFDLFNGDDDYFFCRCLRYNLDCKSPNEMIKPQFNYNYKVTQNTTSYITGENFKNILLKCIGFHPDLFKSRKDIVEELLTSIMIQNSINHKFGNENFLFPLKIEEYIKINTLCLVNFINYSSKVIRVVI